jgi:hypothetical protein
MASAILVVLNWNKPYWLIGGWLIVVGLYGILACIKLYERGLFHERRARMIRDRMSDIQHIAGAAELHETAQETHRRSHPLLSGVRLNWIFLFPNIAVAVLGVAYVVFATAR